MYVIRKAILASASSLLVSLLAVLPAVAADRSMGFGVDFGGTPGRWNAITDVPGVSVGHVTLISGQGTLRRGEGPVRTGVTAVLPRGQDRMAEPVFAGLYSLNGNGELTGSYWVAESGLLSGPIMLTGTTGVGAVRSAVAAWGAEQPDPALAWDLELPVVGETWDGLLNDEYGFHVKPEHAIAAMKTATFGPVVEGSVGGGTGMICHGFKGGIGTASRKLVLEDAEYVLGVLVQCNYGSRRLLNVNGIKVGQAITEQPVCFDGKDSPKSIHAADVPACDEKSLPPRNARREGAGSIIVVVATNAPFLPHQLQRLARRVPLGIGKMGGLGEDGSGEIFVAFSTQPFVKPSGSNSVPVQQLDNGQMNPFFEATVQATQEAILNAMLAAETMTGADRIRVPALPKDRFRALIQQQSKSH